MHLMFQGTLVCVICDLQNSQHQTIGEDTFFVKDNVPVNSKSRVAMPLLTVFICGGRKSQKQSRVAAYQTT